MTIARIHPRDNAFFIAHRAGRGESFSRQAKSTGQGETQDLSAASRSPREVAVWALTNTGSLSSAKPHVRLLHVVVTSEAYGIVGSFSATQKSGSIPLGDTLVNPLEQINANDDRMNQVVSAGGDLYAGVNTSVAIKGQTLQGIAYFIMKPSLDDGVLKAHVSNQGYVAVANENVLFPSIGVTAGGSAVIVFSLSGPDYFPSAAYAPLSDKAGNIRLAGPGVGPDDGFTGYAAEGGNGIGRWGDYSAAVADGDSNIWIAAEFIGQTCSDLEYAGDSTCGGTRTQLANWGTFIGRVPSENGKLTKRKQKGNNRYTNLLFPVVLFNARHAPPYYLRNSVFVASVQLFEAGDSHLQQIAIHY